MGALSPPIALENLGKGQAAPYIKFMNTIFDPPCPSSVTKVSSITAEDLSLLLDSGLYQRWEGPVPLISRNNTLFDIADAAKVRRRHIMWPKDVNEAVHRSNFVSKIPDTLEAALLPSSLKFIKCYDLVRGFYQVSLPASVRAQYAVRVRTPDGAVCTIAPTRLPMGVSYAPDVLQGLLIAIVDEIESTFPGVKGFVFIDNVRLAAPTPELLESASDYWDRRAEEEGIVYRPEPTETFLGMDFDFQSTDGDTFPVRPSQKSRDAIQSQRSLLDADSPEFGAVRELFSRCVYAARVMRLPLAKYYAIFKFMRRHLSKGTSPTARINIWSSALGTWKAWIKLILSAKFVAHPVAGDADPSILFTDASLSGWGAVLVHDNGIFEAAGRWPRSKPFKSGDMGMLETAAVRRAAFSFRRHLANAKAISVVVDSTTAGFALAKGASPSFAVNQEVLGTLAELPGHAHISTSYIRSEDNPADGPSRGKSFSLGQLSSAVGLMARRNADTAVVRPCGSQIRTAGRRG